MDKVLETWVWLWKGALKKNLSNKASFVELVDVSKILKPLEIILAQKFNFGFNFLIVKTVQLNHYLFENETFDVVWSYGVIHPKKKILTNV